MNIKILDKRQSLIGKVNKCNLPDLEKLEVIKIIESSKGGIPDLIWKTIRMAGLSKDILDFFTDE